MSMPHQQQQRLTVDLEMSTPHQRQHQLTIDLETKTPCGAITATKLVIHVRLAGNCIGYQINPEKEADLRRGTKQMQQKLHQKMVKKICSARHYLRSYERYSLTILVLLVLHP